MVSILTKRGLSESVISITNFRLCEDVSRMPHGQHSVHTCGMFVFRCYRSGEEMALGFVSSSSVQTCQPFFTSGCISRRWQPSVNMGMAPFPMQPPTPPRSGLYSANSQGFRGVGPVPTHLPTGGDRSTSGSLSDGHCHPLGGMVGAGVRHVHVHAGGDGQPPMNARWVSGPFTPVPRS